MPRHAYNCTDYGQILQVCLAQKEKRKEKKKRIKKGGKKKAIKR
jgi:hypothetical protein